MFTQTNICDFKTRRSQSFSETKEQYYTTESVSFSGKVGSMGSSDFGPNTEL